MEKKKTPGITIFFYIAGIVFLAVAAFMLVAAVTYTRTYLQSYDASFGDMWSNSIQYIITQFVPYLGVGIVCLGIGRAIKEMKNISVDVDNRPDEEAQARQLAAADKIANGLKKLAAEIETNREVLGIRMEEKEKRDQVRLQELEGDLLYVMKGEKAEAKEEPAKAAETTEEAKAVPAEIPPTPPIFTISRSMVMPACPAVDSVEVAKAEVPTPAEIPPTPPIFTISRSMVMPKCPARKKIPQIFTIARSMVMPACPAIEKKTVRRETFSSEDLEQLLSHMNKKN
ncbi:MAG: hypothetical protein Q4D99_04585 [Bacillota bacterium]|nr:hypothetical protein [Bacillota bacterium]